MTTPPSTDRSEEWGPWITHTPGPCPLALGVWAQVESHDREGRREVKEGRMTEYAKTHPAWFSDGTGAYVRITRYRTKRPPALRALIAECAKLDKLDKLEPA